MLEVTRQASVSSGGEEVPGTGGAAARGAAAESAAADAARLRGVPAAGAGRRPGGARLPLERRRWLGRQALEHGAAHRRCPDAFPIRGFPWGVYNFLSYQNQHRWRL